MSSRFGFSRGFDHFEDVGLASEGAQQPLRHVRGAEATEKALAASRDASGKPFFLFVHYYDPHADYEPEAPWSRTFDEDQAVVPFRGHFAHRSKPLPPDVLEQPKAQYDEEILYTDAMLDRLLQGLEKMGRLQDTLVVLVSDHGEEFFEHGA